MRARYIRLWLMLVAAPLAGSCSNESDRTAVRFEPDAPPGVTCVLHAEHRSNMNVSQIIDAHSEEALTGALLEGDGVDGLSYVYVLAVDVANTGDKSLAFPDVKLSWSGPEDQTTERGVLARRGRIEAGQTRRLVYVWDSGRVVPGLTVRLVWRNA